MSTSLECKHIVVHGKVQGVGFRNFTYLTASKMGVKGWCRNLKTGEVEILAIGAPQILEELLSSVSKGPQFSQVDSLDEKSIELREPESYKEFEVISNGESLWDFELAK